MNEIHIFELWMEELMDEMYCDGNFIKPFCLPVVLVVVYMVYMINLSPDLHFGVMILSTLK